ncbi:thiol reductant ABC exporter subunit CydD [Pseudonocardia abyssalis]|uniref:thiol reductant ABC exporter subunit CydD n=2 Tax=Pseudonocardia abyssalis TaxID=2792008 RepID=UPI001CF641E5|nr:thiol reductant ABC exporter subunit CydD [Pseudonocardia abyssalis]
MRSVAAVRVHLVVVVVLGVATTGLVLVQAWLLARTIATGDLAVAVGALAAFALARAGIAYGGETLALRSAATIKSALRRRLVRHVVHDPHGAGEVVTLATRGLDALDDYVARFLPQLVLAVLVPAAVLVVVARADWISALVIGLTLPLIPLFMALVGWHTRARTQRQWRLLERLAGHFLDVVEGLPTLALFRRSRAAATQIRAATDAHRDATLGTLRIAFLSAFVLEVLATLAVALVAVEVGLRLLYGHLDLETALLVLILAPEAYLPLREVGARFHASTEGVAAAERVFEVLERPVPAEVTGPPIAVPRVVRFDDVALSYGDVPALHGLDLELVAGTTTLVTGRSGAGKSTLLALLLRFASPDSGRITVDGRDLADLSTQQWRRLVAWVPQRPHLFDASLADNIRLGSPTAPLVEVARAAERAGLADVVADLPEGYDTRLGERGTRLSSGQRQRVALARAFLRRAPIVLLDEPTAHLDAEAAAGIRTAVADLVHGTTAVIVAHDDGWAELADAVVRLDPAAADPTADPTAANPAAHPDTAAPDTAAPGAGVPDAVPGAPVPEPVR